VPTSFPSDPAKLRRSSFFNAWWYYTVELLPGVVTKGLYPPELPMLPRMLLRRCDLADMDALDIGTMEGLIPVLMKRRGARYVLAVDAINHCAAKLAAVKHYYGVDFDFRDVGLMYDLDAKLPAAKFDFINLSGLLYHVFSPLMVLCAVRPLLKRDGLLMIATGVTFDDRCRMEFNAAGRMQGEANTFWYLSVPLVDYLLRFLRLAPLDCVYLRHDGLRAPHTRLQFDVPSGYLAVVCRAVDEALPSAGDAWMLASAGSSWEYRELVDWDRCQRQPRSRISYTVPRDHLGADTLDLWATVRNTEPINEARATQESHALLLADQH
jgi:SAM-dependent methyltransferase